MKSPVVKLLTVDVKKKCIKETITQNLEQNKTGEQLFVTKKIYI